MKRMIIITLLVLFAGCSNEVAKKDVTPLAKQIMPVGANWAEMYDANDLEVAQTYNIAVLRAALLEMLQRIKKLEAIVDPNEAIK